jgi:hypothetical protein
MVVVEDEDRLVIRVPRAADANVPRTEIAALDVVGHRWRRRHGALALPRPILSMRRDDHPLLPERVPPLLPGGSIAGVHFPDHYRPLRRRGRQIAVGAYP